MTASDVAVAAAVVAELVERLPARLRRKLEGDAHLGDGWPREETGDGILVRAGADTLVTLRPVGGVVSSVAQVTCSCLIGPGCLHAVVVLRALPLAATEPPSAGLDAADEPPPAAVVLTPAQRAAAGRAAAALGRLLVVGAAAAGLVVEAELLRAAQACRAEGLHRVAGGLLRSVQRVRDLHAERPEFRLEVLAADVADALTSADRLGRSADQPPADAVGTARRAYRPVGNLRLTGLCCEPVVSAAGYAGVVTHLLSADGRPWTVPGVLPGTVDRVLPAYRGGAGIGDTALSHRDLAGGGLHVARATASDDGRLGAGRDVRVVAREGAGWDEDDVAVRFHAPLSEQLGRAWPDGLVLFEATVAGAAGPALVLADVGDDALPVLAVTPAEHVELPGYDNLLRLAAAPGLRVRAVGRVVADEARTVRLLAVSPVDPAAMSLPDGWRNRVNVGLDRLQGAHLPGAGDRPNVVAGVDPAGRQDPLDAFRRRLHRVVLGGRATVGPLGRAGVDHDAGRLRADGMATAADLLAGVADAAADGARLARAWAGAVTYEAAATAVLARDAWLSG